LGRFRPLIAASLAAPGGEREDRAIEMLAAKKLLADPTLDARALGSVPVGGERPVSTARVSR
jgi:hypothetical protein